MNKFNLHGYGLTLIDAKGTVRGVNIHGEELKKLLKTLYPKAGEDQKGPGKAVKKDER